MAIQKAYVTKRARQYLISTKYHMADIIRERGYTPTKLSSETRIPLASLVRWLDVNHDSFMPLTAAVVIADTLAIPVRSVLPPDDMVPANSDRYQAIEVFLTAPVPHVVMMAEHYRKVIRVMR